MSKSFSTIATVIQFLFMALLNKHVIATAPEVNFEDIFVPCEDWKSKIAEEVVYLVTPVPFAIVYHTATDECGSKMHCSVVLEKLQKRLMDRMLFANIGSNFLVGGDGLVYEGAGWHRVGSHTSGFNNRSIGIGFIGNFTERSPSSQQLWGLKNFLAYAVEQKQLSKDYKLMVKKSQTALYDVIKRHFGYT